MAERRMFAKTITESDAFRDMPLSTQALYFHLGMEADDDGVVNKAKQIQRGIGASDDDLKILIAKKFIIPFETGVIVIKHWKMNNFIRTDRYKPTVYQEEMAQLSIKENGSYTFGIPSGNQVVTKRYTQTSIGKVSIDKNSIVQTTVCSLLTDDEFKRLDSTYEDILGLIDLVDRTCPDINSIKHPLSYVVTVAERNEWPTK